MRWKRNWCCIILTSLLMFHCWQVMHSDIEWSTSYTTCDLTKELFYLVGKLASQSTAVSSMLFVPTVNTDEPLTQQNLKSRGQSNQGASWLLSESSALCLELCLWEKMKTLAHFWRIWAIVEKCARDTWPLNTRFLKNKIKNAGLDIKKESNVLGIRYY